MDVKTHRVRFERRDGKLWAVCACGNQAEGDNQALALAALPCRKRPTG